jgi:hypothetical protein
MAFATPADVYALGLPPAAFKSTPRTIEDADSTTGVLTLSNNGLASGALLRFSVEGQAAHGATENALPGGVSLSTMYTATPYAGSSDLFQVTPTGGSLMTSFSSAAVGPFAIVVDNGPALLAQLDAWTAIIGDTIIDLAPPVMPDTTTGLHHYKLRTACAHLVGRHFATMFGLANPNYADSMKPFLEGPLAKMVDGWMTEWRAGVPLRPTPIDATPGIPDNGPLASYDAVASVWQTGTL